MTSERSEFEKWAAPILAGNPNWRESGDCELAWQSWQARAALATQPAAGEPEQQTAINADDLPTKKYPLGALDFDAPMAAGELVRVVAEPGEELSPSNLVGNRIDRMLTIGTRLYTAPPAAAHEAVPSGYVLVPVEPTIAQLAALGFNGDEDAALGHGRACVELTERYKSMLKVAPAAAHGDDRVAGLRWVIARCAVMQEKGFERVLLKAFKRDLEVALDAMRAQAGEGGEV